MIPAILTCIWVFIAWNIHIQYKSFKNLTTFEISASVYISLGVLMYFLAVICGPVKGSTSIYEQLPMLTYVEAAVTVLLTATQSRLLRLEVFLQERIGVDPMGFDTLEEVQGAVGISLDILNDLLSYEKLESGLLTLEQTAFVAADFLMETMRPFLMQARRLEIELHTSLDNFQESTLLSNTYLKVIDTGAGISANNNIDDTYNGNSDEYKNNHNNNSNNNNRGTTSAVSTRSLQMSVVTLGSSSRSISPENLRHIRVQSLSSSPPPPSHYQSQSLSPSPPHSQSHSPSPYFSSSQSSPSLTRFPSLVALHSSTSTMTTLVSAASTAVAYGNSNSNTNANGTSSTRRRTGTVTSTGTTTANPPLVSLDH
eukprot:gene3785-7519_t